MFNNMFHCHFTYCFTTCSIEDRLPKSEIFCFVSSSDLDELATTQTNREIIQTFACKLWMIEHLIICFGKVVASNNDQTLF